jgi:hypothetical protein
MGEELTRAKEIDEAVKAADAKKRADAEEAAMAGGKLDRILDCMDALGKRLDSIEAERATKKEGSSEGEGEIGEDDKPKPLGADDSADAEEIADYKARNGATHKRAGDSVLAEIQSEACCPPRRRCLPRRPQRPSSTSQPQCRRPATPPASCREHLYIY